MATDAVGGLLQGFNNGLASGLDFYKTIQGEARAKRQEQVQAERFARQDMEADRTYDFNREKYTTEKDQWEQNFGLLNDQFEFSKTQHTDDVALRSRAVGVQEANQGLKQREFDYQVSEDARTRHEKNAESLLSASLIDGDGQYITDDRVYAERANQNPQVIKAALDLAAARGLIDPERVKGYTGAQLIPTPQGMALRVAGTDATGKPIKPGGGVLSENGTDDPNDPYMLINVGQLRQMVDPKFRDAQRSSALARDQVNSYTTQSQTQEAETLTSLESSVAEQQAAVTASEKQLAALQAERDALEKDKPRSLGGYLKSKTMGLAREVNPAIATLIDPRGTLEHYAGTDTDAKRLQTDAAIAEANASLASGRTTLNNLTSRLGEAPQVFAANRERYKNGVVADSRLHADQYANNTLASAVKYPETQAKATKAAEKNFGTVVDNVLKDNTFTPRKGEPGPKVSAAELRTVLNAMPPEIQLKIGSSRQYEAALYDVAHQIAQTGIVADPVFMLEARAAGADLDAYVEYLAAPQNAGRDVSQVHAEAVEIGKQKAANPAASTATLSGALRMQ